MVSHHKVGKLWVNFQNSIIGMKTKFKAQLFEWDSKTKLLPFPTTPSPLHIHAEKSFAFMGFSDHPVYGIAN